VLGCLRSRPYSLFPCSANTELLVFARSGMWRIVLCSIILLLRIVWGHSSMARYLAALCFLIGALISRYAWIEAGRVSSRDPQALFRIQRPAPNAAAH
jgi:hypothetical protein